MQCSPSNYAFSEAWRPTLRPRDIFMGDRAFGAELLLARFFVAAQH